MSLSQNLPYNQNLKELSKSGLTSDLFTSLETARDAGLGSIGKLRAKSGRSESTWRSGQKELYKMLEVSRSVFRSHESETNDKRFRSACFCGRQIAPMADHVGVHVTGETAHYSHMLQCKSVWVCPACADRITRGRAQEVAALSAAASAAGDKLLMVTFTQQHNRSSLLSDELTISRAARHAFSRSRIVRELLKMIGFNGRVAALEITDSMSNGWHVHHHDLYVLNLASGRAHCQQLRADLIVQRGHYAKRCVSTRARDRVLAAATCAEIDDKLLIVADVLAALDECELAPDRADLEPLRLLIARLWVQQLRAAGAYGSLSHAVHVRLADADASEYLAKWGRDRAGGGWSAESEMTRAKLKRGRAGSLSPFQLLSLCSSSDDGGHDRPMSIKRARARWIEYCIATRGRAQIRYSRGLQALYGLADTSDDDLIETDEPLSADTLVAAMTRDDVRALRRTGLLAELKFAAIDAGAVGVAAILQQAHTLSDIYDLPDGRYIRTTGNLATDTYETKYGLVVGGRWRETVKPERHG